MPRAYSLWQPGGAGTKSSAKIAPNGEFSAKTAPHTTAKTVPTANPAAAEAAIIAAAKPEPMPKLMPLPTFA